MKKNIIIVGVVGLLLSSCVSQKKYSDLESLQQNTKELLDSATAKLGATETQLSATSERLAALSEQNKFLRANNQDLIDNIGNLTTLTQKGAENLERSLESIKEKDLIITRMQDAVTKRDSVTLKINMLSMFLFSTEEDISYLYVSIEEQEITKKDIKT